MLNTKKGFTLIELLIVITIIGILAAALLPNILGAPARARDAARSADLNNIVAAIETYSSDEGMLPTTNATQTTIEGGCVSDLAHGFDTTYFPGGDVPNDPSTDGLTNNCTNGYVYCPTDGSNNTSYFVAALVENEANANYDDGGGTAVGDCTAGGIAPPTLTPGVGDALLVIK